MGEEVNAFIFYIHVHSKIKDRWTNIVSIKDAKSFLFQWRIPKELRPIVMKELEMLSLLKKKGKYHYEILDCPVDINDTNSLYEHYGIY